MSVPHGRAVPGGHAAPRGHVVMKRWCAGECFLKVRNSVVLDLCCEWAFSSCCEQGCSSSWRLGLVRWRLLLQGMDPREHGLP